MFDLELQETPRHHSARNPSLPQKKKIFCHRRRAPHPHHLGFALHSICLAGWMDRQVNRECVSPGRVTHESWPKNRENGEASQEFWIRFYW